MRKLGIVLCLLLTSVGVRAQNIENLVFEGAGIKGIAYVGALKCLQDSGKLQDIKKIGGTSSGAITATLFAVGYTADEIENLMRSTKYQKFNDGQYYFAGGFYRLKKYFGWYKGDEFLQWIESRISDKLDSTDVTFSQLLALTKMDLCITGTNLSMQRTEYFNANNYPNMRIADAVRISMSIPVYYEAVWMDSVGNTFNTKDQTQNAWLMIDGGMTANFPISMFDTIQTNGKRWINTKTLAFRIDDTLQKSYNEANKGIAPKEINTFSDYMGALYDYTMESLNSLPLKEEDWGRTVSISSGEVGPKVRELKPEEVRTLYQNGYKAVSAYLVKQ